MWKNRFVIHIPVGKLLQLYIFDFDALFSCQWKLHMMHIFWWLCSYWGNCCSRIFTKRDEYPQTHNLWITFAVDAQNPSISAFSFIAKTDIPCFSTWIHSF